MTKIAAVTGATGFVGKHLVRALVAEGYHVKALTRRPQKESSSNIARNIDSNIEWIAGDLKDIPALTHLMEQADVVFHLAGLIKAKNKADFYDINSQSVKTLTSILQKSAITQKSGATPHFILLSSLAARERHLSSYADSKRQGEEMLTDQENIDIPWTILRPPGVYGPEDRETLKIFKSISAHLAPLPASSNNRASWVYAPDLAEALIATANNQNCFGKILDVDDGKDGGYSNQEMYETAAKILNISPFYFIIPKFILKIFAHFNALFSTLFTYTPMLTPEKINELCHPDWICGDPHVMRMTDWKPKTGLKQGFEKTLKWYKENELM